MSTHSASNKVKSLLETTPKAPGGRPHLPGEKQKSNPDRFCPNVHDAHVQNEWFKRAKSWSSVSSIEVMISTSAALVGSFYNNAELQAII